MGRHSAPADDEDDQVDVAVVTEEPVGHGRHARAGGPVGDGPADPFAPVVPTRPPPVRPAEGSNAPADRKRHSSSGDFALVAHHGDVRNRCVAGLIVPFVLYVAVMLAIGATGRQVLLWVFIPLVTAGVLVGVFLDAGHKRHAGGGAGRHPGP